MSRESVFCALFSMNTGIVLCCTILSVLHGGRTSEDLLKKIYMESWYFILVNYQNLIKRLLQNFAGTLYSLIISRLDTLASLCDHHVSATCISTNKSVPVIPAMIDATGAAESDSHRSQALCVSFLVAYILALNTIMLITNILMLFYKYRYVS